MARVAANGEGCEAATSRLGSMSSTSAGTPPPRSPREPCEGTDGTPAPRLLLARLADADGAAMGVARHNDLVADQN